MKTEYVLRRRALLGISALFCTTLLLFGCQDTAIPVGPELDSPVAFETVGDTYAGKKPEKGAKALLFLNASSTCAEGATPNGNSFGTVNWSTRPTPSDQPAPAHIHFSIQLKGVAPGEYTLVGQQFKLDAAEPCQNEVNITEINGAIIIVKNNGRGSTRTALRLLDHSPGLSNVWVTVSGPGGVFRSPAVTIDMPDHDGHP